MPNQYLTLVKRLGAAAVDAWNRLNGRKSSNNPASFARAIVSQARRSASFAALVGFEPLFILCGVDSTWTVPMLQSGVAAGNVWRALVHAHANCQGLPASCRTERPESNNLPVLVLNARRIGCSAKARGLMVLEMVHLSVVLGRREAHRRSRTFCTALGGLRCRYRDFGIRP
jgi:hypothetical protein